MCWLLICVVTIGFSELLNLCCWKSVQCMVINANGQAMIPRFWNGCSMRVMDVTVTNIIIGRVANIVIGRVYQFRHLICSSCSIIAVSVKSNMRLFAKLFVVRCACSSHAFPRSQNARAQTMSGRWYRVAQFCCGVLSANFAEVRDVIAIAIMVR